MKQALIASAIAAFVASSLSSSAFDDEGNAAYWNRERGNVSSGYKAPSSYGNLDKSRAAMLVANEARRQLGEQWVATALKIAKVESGYRCSAIGPRTRYGHAQGLMQVLPSSAERLEPGSSRNLTDCATGARVGVAHMAGCLAMGATTPALMSLCHVSGGINRRLNRRATIYARSYQRMVNGANPLVVADASGWLTRGSTSILALR